MALVGLGGEMLTLDANTFATAPVFLLDLRTQQHYYARNAGWHMKDLLVVPESDTRYMTPVTPSPVLFIDEGEVALVAGVSFMNKVAIVAPDIVGLYESWYHLDDDYRYCLVSRNDYTTFAEFLARRAESFLSEIIKNKGDARAGEAAKDVYFQSSVVADLDEKRCAIILGAYHLTFGDAESVDRYFTIAAMPLKRMTRRGLIKASRKYIDSL